jgi:hypothetical protein
MVEPHLEQLLEHTQADIMTLSAETKSLAGARLWSYP